MANIKHVGQIINTQRRCVVVFREVPDEPENCLIRRYRRSTGLDA